MRVIEAPDAKGALSAFASLVASRQAAGLPTVAVSAEEVQPGLVRRDGALRRLAADPKSVAVVLGGARLLGRELGRVADERRIHVAVVVRSSEAEARRLELAAPAALRRHLGAPPLSLPERRRWRQSALRLFRREEVALTPRLDGPSRELGRAR